MRVLTCDRGYRVYWLEAPSLSRSLEVMCSEVTRPVGDLHKRLVWSPSWCRCEWRPLSEPWTVGLAGSGRGGVSKVWTDLPAICPASLPAGRAKEGEKDVFNLTARPATPVQCPDCHWVRLGVDWKSLAVFVTDPDGTPCVQSPCSACGQGEAGGQAIVCAVWGNTNQQRQKNRVERRLYDAE